MSQGVCMNCREPITTAPRTFQGVVICETCFRIVSRMVERTKNEMQMVFLAYTDMLRVSLVRGELRPPLAVPARQEMSKTSLAQAIQSLARKVGQHAEIGTETSGESSVPVVRSPENDSDGEVRDG